jgi:uncharacterized protein with NRDE domain
MEESYYWKDKYFVDRETGRILADVVVHSAYYGTHTANYGGESVLFIDEGSAKKWIEKCFKLENQTATKNQ